MAKSSLHNAVTLTLETTDLEAIVSSLAGLGGVNAVERLPSDGAEQRLRVYPELAQDISAKVAAALHEHQATVRQLQIEQGRMDEVFRMLTLSDSNA